MSWFRVDDGMLDHPKWIKAIRDGGDAALHLWMRMGTWSSRHLTDGEIPAHVVESLPGPRGGKTRERAWQALADASLIHRRSDGSVTLHDYLDYNPSRAKVTSERQRKTKDKQNQRDRDSVTGDRPPTVDGDRAVPSRPVPSPDLTLTRAAGPELTEPPTHTRVPNNWQPTEAFYGEASMAGVTRADLDEAVRYWRGRKLGGEWFTIEDFFRGKFVQIRRRRETESFKRASAAPDGRRVALPAEPGDDIDFDPRFIDVGLRELCERAGVEPEQAARDWRAEAVRARKPMRSKEANQAFAAWVRARGRKRRSA